VIGLGRAFSLMVPTLAHHPKVEIVAGTDVRADARALRARVCATAHPSAEALAGDPNVEAIYISTPHELHAAHAHWPRRTASTSWSRSRWRYRSPTAPR
jgi:phthalate 4,5-cis-dihydrodiol dehydrogenase